MPDTLFQLTGNEYVPISATLRPGDGQYVHDSLLLTIGRAQFVLRDFEQAAEILTQCAAALTDAAVEAQMEGE